MRALRHSTALMVLVVAVAASARGAAGAPNETPPPLKEEARDRATAAAHFATGKSLYEKGEPLGALRCYQRAWRWDPSRGQLLDEVIPLAVSVGRVDEAVRYALIAAERGRVDPDMLRRLALFATEQQEWPRAARLYRMWLKALPDGAQGVSRALVQLELGRLEHLSGNVDAASDAFAHTQRELLGDPESPTARRLRAALGGALGDTWETFGRCHLEAGELELAARAFDQMIANPDTQRAGRYWAARLALEDDRPLDAYESIWGYFDGAGEPLGALPYQTLGDALVRLNDAERLEKDIERLRRAKPGSCYATLALAESCASSGREAHAEALFESLVRRGTGEHGEREVDGHALVDAGRWLINRYAGARQANRFVPLIRLLARRSESLAPFQPALEKVMADESFARDVVARLKVAGDSSDSPTDYLAAARLALLGGEEELAGESFRAAIEDSRESADRRALSWGVDLLLGERYARAAADLRWAIDQGALDESAAPAWFYLGTALALEGDHDAALEATRRAAQMAPDSAELVARPAWVLQNAERTDEAIAAYKRLIERFDDDQDPATRAVVKDARMALSYLALAEDDPRASAEWLEQVLDEFPDDIGAKNDLGYLWADRNEHLRRARRMIEQAVAAEPDNAAYLDSLGWVRFRLGDLPGALDAIQGAVAIESAGGGEADAEILDHLGDVLQALGRPQDAADAWRRAAEQFDEANDERAAEAQEKLESLPHPAQPPDDPAG